MLDSSTTELGRCRLTYQPKIPEILTNLSHLTFISGEKTTCVAKHSFKVEQAFPNTYGRPLITYQTSKQKESRPKPLKVGMVLSGGPAAGGHNVIAGLFDGVKAMHKDSECIGFLKGPKGVMNNKTMTITATLLEKYRNTGGFDMLGTGRDKISTKEDMQASLNSVTSHNLDGLIIIGGDDSNTNAAVLAEYFVSKGSKCVVIGVPKTIDGDLQNEYIEISFGFDTATKVFAGLIANICRDAKSSLKKWHFIKLMGRDASHVTLESALYAKPNITLIGEEWNQESVLLPDIIDYICDRICDRADQGINYGVVLVPEGLLSFIPTMSKLFDRLGDLMAHKKHRDAIENLKEQSEKIKYVRKLLTSATIRGNFDVLPKDIQIQIIGERDAHGNINLSQIPTESLLIQTCAQELLRRKKKGEYVGKFKTCPHFFGYDGRCAFPTNFDANYCYALGLTASLLTRDRMNGYMCRVFDLEKRPEDWGAGGVPITMLLNYERRNNRWKPVIKKALVDIDGPVYRHFYARRKDWAAKDSYQLIGGVQYFGPPTITDAAPLSIHIKKQKTSKL